MLSIGAIAFAAPWVLVALVGLPILWWLLKVTPPAPRLMRFPAIRLLFGLRQDEQTPARTPLWLILLRMAIASLVILGLAQPVTNPANPFPSSGPLVLVVDDGWAAARGWTRRIEASNALIDRAGRAERAVMILTTARPKDGGPLPPAKLLTAGAARTFLQALQPKPWPTYRSEALKLLQALKLEKPANVFWITDGVEDGDEKGVAQSFVRTLTKLGRVTIMADGPGEGALALVPPEAGATRLIGRLLRTQSSVEASIQENYWVRGLDDRGRLLLREKIHIAAGARTGETVLPLPAELRNRLTRLEIEGITTAGTVALFDERWRRRPVGIVTATADRAQTRPLLSEIYYLDRALSPYSEIRKGPVQTLLARPLAVLIVADGSILTESDRKAVKAWLNKGGTVLRFAGPRLAQKPDDLTPVALRVGDRALGGTMSWTKPARLAPFVAASPFNGLTVPADVLVRRQVLAQPALDLPNRTWARLADGTPLVTAVQMGRGRLILIHTTANTEWANLAISGLFIDMLRRVVNLSQGVTGAHSKPLPPVSSLDGFGRFTDPPAAAQPLAPDAATENINANTNANATAIGPDGKVFRTRLGPTRPPGFYGNDAARFALNLGTGLKSLEPLGPMPAGIDEFQIKAPEETDFKPLLLALALGLLLADLWIGLVLRGLAPEFWPLRRNAGADSSAAIIIALLMASSLLGATASAQSPPAQPATTSDTRAMEATFDTRLAYILTGDTQTDEVSRAGLVGLSHTLRTRTSVEPKAPLAVDVERDELSFFPFIYWPVTRTQPLPSLAARDKLARYLRGGGMILFDTRDQGSGRIIDPGGISPAGAGASQLRRILSGLQVPGLIPVPRGHVLTKAFYLLKEFPGRWTGGTLWVEKATGHANDGVSSVVIGANDFAAAWAIDSVGRTLYPVVPGGAQQREMALRFGVNLVMYALTGNYKSDQVHVPAILERLGQ